MTESPTFHAGSKLRWLEQVASDRAVTDFEVRLAIAISRRTSGAFGEAIATQIALAQFIGGTERGVRKAAQALRAHGHLEIDNAGCGRGRATTYRPIVKNPERRFQECRSRKSGTTRHERRNGGSLLSS